MRYALTTEQEQFGQMIREFLTARAPESGLLARIESDNRFDRQLWADLCEQLELPGLAVPEAHGGSGFGQIERAVVLEELGRALTPVPYFATAVMALPLILAADTGQASGVITDLASGASIGAAALAEPGTRAFDAPVTAATRATHGHVLNGHKTLVIDGDLADIFVVSAEDDGQTALFIVEATADGVEVQPHTMFDPTRGTADVRFDGAPATRVGSGSAQTAIDDVLDRARIAMAAEQVGGTARCLDIAVEHAQTREQFGQAIGKFQSVKHQCAGMLYDLETARSAMWYAAWAAEDAPDELADVVPVAKYLCSTAFQEAARATVHILGGIGFTWEHPAHLFFKRATTSAQFLGSAHESLYRLADQMLDGSQQQ